MRLYVDTNVYLDFLLKRGTFSDYAGRLFAEAASCKHTILFSNHVASEMTRYVILEDCQGLFAFLKPKLEKIPVLPEDRISAESLPTHFADALHITLAMRAGADCIITRNTSDFRHIFKTKTPEEILGGR